MTSPPKTWTACPRGSGPSGCRSCGGWWTAWKVNGWASSPAWTLWGGRAEQGIQAASTASWLRSRLHLGASAATSAVRTARALFRGPLTRTAQALRDGEISAAHAAVVAPRHPRPPRPGHRRGRAGPARGGLLPPTLGGAPSQPLDLGRTTRVVSPAQRTALAVRDAGCVFPDCDRPLSWCESHHLLHWVDGGPTDLTNLALLCRQHHRTVHEGGWQLTRGPDGRFTATPAHRAHPAHRRHRGAA